jgi:hypothetical protein
VFGWLVDKSVPLTYLTLQNMFWQRKNRRKKERKFLYKQSPYTFLC